MSRAFSRSHRSLALASNLRWILPLFAGLGLFGCWAAWGLMARVGLYETSDEARLEVLGSSFAVQSEMSGKVLAAPRRLGDEVRAGDVLAELDSGPLRQRILAQRARLASAREQLAAIDVEIESLEASSELGEKAAGLAVEQARARHLEAAAEASLLSQMARQDSRLLAQGYAPRAASERSRALAKQGAAAKKARKVDVERVEHEQAFRTQQLASQLAKLRRERRTLVGEFEVAEAAATELQTTAERYRVRAPVDGILAEVAELQPGSVVSAGQTIASVVPQGRIGIVARYPPRAAMGRLHAGQSAIVKLDGFPWTEFGVLEATVERVGGEVRDGRVRVELTIDGATANPELPLQHGLPAAVEVEVDRVTPFELLLRSAGARGSRA